MRMNNHPCLLNEITAANLKRGCYNVIHISYLGADLISMGGAYSFLSRTIATEDELAVILDAMEEQGLFALRNLVAHNPVEGPPAPITRELILSFNREFISCMNDLVEGPLVYQCLASENNLSYYDRLHNLIKKDSSDSKSDPHSLQYLSEMLQTLRKTMAQDLLTVTFTPDSIVKSVLDVDTYNTIYERLNKVGEMVGIERL